MLNKDAQINAADVSITFKIPCKRSFLNISLLKISKFK